MEKVLNNGSKFDSWNFVFLTFKTMYFAQFLTDSNNLGLKI